MGGYGALKCALTYPERFSHCAAFSSACDIQNLLERWKISEHKTLYRELQTIFGETETIAKEDDLFALAEKTALQPKDKQPKIYMTCGTQDIANGIYESNLKLKKHLAKLQYDLCYEEWDAGHTWSFWDQSVRQALRYFA